MPADRHAVRISIQRLPFRGGLGRATGGRWDRKGGGAQWPKEDAFGFSFTLTSLPPRSSQSEHGCAPPSTDQRGDGRLKRHSWLSNMGRAHPFLRASW